MRVHDTFAEASSAPAPSGASGVRADGPEGFAEFVRATGDRMHRAALLLSGDHHLAEDLTQTTYAKVFAAWHRVSRADSPKDVPFPADGWIEGTPVS